MPKAAELPNDIEALKGIVLKHSAALEAATALVIAQKLELEKLRFEIACLKRMKYGRSSEQLDAQLTQMQLTLEDLEASLAEQPPELVPPPKEPPAKPVRRSPAPTMAANGPPRSTASLAPPSSTTSIPKATCATSSSASLTIL